MKKSVLLLLLILVMVFATACGDSDFSELSTSAITESKTEEQPPEPVLLPNRLTGLKTVEEGQENARPVAVMVNNISVAQRVQCGLADADVVFECMVEGGITRLMAVFSDISKVGQIGSCRSARYTYVQLAKSLDALYVHCGVDRKYTQSYMHNILDDYELGSHSSATFRENNGLAWEHRLFVTGEGLDEATKKDGFRRTTEKTASLFNFTDEALTTDTPCKSVSYVMSSSYKTTFAYDTQTGKYTRCPKGTPHKDNKTGAPTQFTNVFILYADTVYFDDNYHVRTIFTSGKGLYVSGGYAKEVTWSKGDASDSLKVKDANGNDLAVTAGNSWIAFAPNKQKSSTVISAE